MVQMMLDNAQSDRIADLTAALMNLITALDEMGYGHLSADAMQAVEQARKILPVEV